MPPVLEQPRRLRSYPPVVAVRQLSPAIHVVPDQSDDGGVVVLLFRRGEPLAFIEHEGRLLGRAFPFLRLGDGRDELRAPTRLNDLVGRLAVLIQFPMATWVIVRRVEDRLVEEGISHLGPWDR